MRIGFRTGVKWERDILLANKLGFEDLEPEWDPNLSAQFYNLGLRARDNGIMTSAVLTGCDPMTLDQFEQAFEDCKKIEAKCFVSHPHAFKADNKPVADEFQTRFSAACELAKKYDLKLAVHSCGLSPRYWDIMFDLVPDLWLKYDPSFSAQDGENYVAEIFRYRKRICHVHAKDENPLYPNEEGRIRFEYAPAGMGQIRWGSVIAALHEGGFTEQIAIEPHSAYWCDDGLELGLILAKRHLEQFLVW